MQRKHQQPEEIVAKLRQVEVLTGQGRLISEAALSIEVSEQRYVRWRAEHGDMKTDHLYYLSRLIPTRLKTDTRPFSVGD